MEVVRVFQKLSTGTGFSTEVGRNKQNIIFYIIIFLGELKKENMVAMFFKLVPCRQLVTFIN